MKIELIPSRASEIKEAAQGNAQKQILGAELFEEPFANIFLCARKKSGKTTVLYNILKHCAGRTTKVICFASTIYKDAQWLRIHDILRDNKVEMERHVSMYDEKGENVLKSTMLKLQKEAQESIAMEEAMEKQEKDKQKHRLDEKRNKKRKIKPNDVLFRQDKHLKFALHDYAKKRRLLAPELEHVILHDDIAQRAVVGFNDDADQDIAEHDFAFQSGTRMFKDRDIDIKKIEEERKQSQNEGFIVPEYIFVFDDLSNELKDPVVSHLLKTNRHYKSKIIISSQYVQDVAPSSRKQIDYWLLFGGHSPDKLEVIHRDADTRLTFEQFVRVYKKITKPDYQFLLLNTTEDEYRRNFDSKPLQVKQTSKAKLSNHDFSDGESDGDEDEEYLSYEDDSDETENDE